MKFGKKLLFLAFLGVFPAAQAQAMEQELVPAQEENTEIQFVKVGPLSDEIWIHIFSFLTPQEIATLNGTCKHFHALCDNTPANKFWLLPIAQATFDQLQSQINSILSRIEFIEQESRDSEMAASNRGQWLRFTDYEFSEKLRTKQIDRDKQEFKKLFPAYNALSKYIENLKKNGDKQ